MTFVGSYAPSIVQGDAIADSTLQLSEAGNVGWKAIGLSLLPRLWRPPFAVLPTSVFESWLAGDLDGQRQVLWAAAEIVETQAKPWLTSWHRGLILRSSASTESLENRGMHTSLRLASDFGCPSIADALSEMYIDFASKADCNSLAVVIQPLVSGRLGHLSNERRVSRTINHWQWEQILPTPESGRVNSQRDTPPAIDQPLSAQTRRALMRLFGSVGRWVNQLKRGRAHLEWAYDQGRLWLLQLDFEDEMPDDGVNPEQWLRDADPRPAGTVPQGSPFRRVDISLPAGPWRKVENLRAFVEARDAPFPSLITITADEFERAIATGYDLEADLDAFAHGRVVCRTDCCSEGVRRENLPRTHTVSSAEAVKEMTKFLSQMKERGASSNEVCFILHKFIPAQAGAWVKVDLAEQIVLVDSLWGVPDGLMYLPHDRFQYDTRKRTVTGERIRYKPRFIQEGGDGNWRELRVRRSFARRQSLSAADVAAIAETSVEIAKSIGEPALIMWFCGIPEDVQVGRNLPWFRMPPGPKAARASQKVAPQWPKRSIRTEEDLDALEKSDLGKTVLVLEPSVDLIRDDKKFIERVIQLAKPKGTPVQIAGSSLAHAYYILEKERITVIPADDASRSRLRSRQSFEKLVRDHLPRQIAGQGEVVVETHLPRSELRQALVAKLFEESQELLSARDPDDVKAELADLLEVIRSISMATGVDWNEVEAAAVDKRSKRGGFETGAVLILTAWPAPGRPVQRGPLAISLRDLARVTTNAQQTTVSFNALVAAGQEGADITFREHDMRVRLTRDGLHIVAPLARLDSATQLDLPFITLEQHEAEP